MPHLLVALVHTIPNLDSVRCFFQLLISAVHIHIFDEKNNEFQRITFCFFFNEGLFDLFNDHDFLFKLNHFIINLFYKFILN